MDQLNSFIETCQEASYCMLHPQEDSAGWFFWIIWIIFFALIVSGLVSSWQVRGNVLFALKNPTEYRGRMGREEFSNAFFGLQALRVCILIGMLLLIAIFGKSLTSVAILLAGFCLEAWVSVALYCVVVRRGHDFAFSGTESLLAYLSHIALLTTRYRNLASVKEQQDTWYVICNNKGNPYANCFGSAPEENNYLIPPEKDWNSENREFPNVWDEADWKSMNQQQRNPYKRTYWKREDR